MKFLLRIFQKLDIKVLGILFILDNAVNFITGRMCLEL